MNTLTWADIDFNLIQSGMITGGGQNSEQQTLVSFAEYLTVFLETVKHRQLFFTGSINLRLKRMKFNTGSIRRAAMLDVDDNPALSFTQSYRWLFFYVFTSLRYQTFYSIEVLDDPVNAEDYELPNVLDEEPVAGFAAFMGLTPEEYELIKRIGNNQRVTHREIFTARMLRILFDVFTKYTISTKSYQSNWTGQDRSWVAGPIEDNTLTRDVSKTWRGSGGVTEYSENWESANNDAYDDYKNDPFDGFPQEGEYINNPHPSFNADNQMVYHRQSFNTTVFVNTQYTSVGYRSIEGHSLVWSFKNKDDQFVDVQFSMYGLLVNNIVEIDKELRTIGSYEIIRKRETVGSYYNDFPLHEGVEPVKININNFLSDPQELQSGIYRSYNFSGKYPPDPMPKNTDTNKYGGLEGYDFGGYDKRSDFYMTSPMFVYADVNSEGFDYYVDPELWPADD